MKFSEIKRRTVNPDDKAFYSRRYAICNEFGPIAGEKFYTFQDSQFLSHADIINKVQS